MRRDWEMGTSRRIGRKCCQGIWNPALWQGSTVVDVVRFAAADDAAADAAADAAGSVDAAVDAAVAAAAGSVGAAAADSGDAAAAAEVLALAGSGGGCIAVVVAAAGMGAAAAVAEMASAIVGRVAHRIDPSRRAPQTERRAQVRNVEHLHLSQL